MEESNITPELCEALSKLTKKEWRQVRFRMNRLFDEATAKITKPAFEKADAETCGVSAPDLLVLLNR